MLPFLKNKEASVAESAEDEPLKRKSDDGESFEILDAIAEDILSAIKSDSKSHLKSALDALCEYLKQEDEEQDQSLINKEE